MDMAGVESSNIDLEEIILYLIAVSEILVDASCAIFLFNEFRYPKSPFRNPYFIMLAPGLLITVIDLIVRLLSFHNEMSAVVNWKSVLSSIVQWFSQNALGIWIFYLGLNRCTAITSPTLHSKVS